jgi:hypothetical protein
VYGISQKPDTSEYILIQNNFINFTNWISKNEQIDDFIQEMQLKFENYFNIIFEWIPYNQFSNIEEIGKNDFMTAYSAVWKDGPLYYYSNYRINSNKEVALKCLHNSQNSVELLISEV